MKSDLFLVTLAKIVSSTILPILNHSVTIFKQTTPDTRHKMRLVSVLSTFENNTGRTYGHMDRWTDGRTQPLIEMRRRI